MKPRRWLEANPLWFVALLAVVFAGTAWALFAAGWSVVVATIDTQLATSPSPQGPTPPRTTATMAHGYVANIVTPLGELVVRACRPKAACTSAPIAFIDAPASDRWSDAASRVFQELLSGAHGVAKCRTLGAPAAMIDCDFPGHDPRAALLAAGLVTLNRSECDAADRPSLCATLSASERSARERGRGVWSDRLWARGPGEAVATLTAAGAAILGSGIIAASGLCVALWYAVHGGAEGLAKRLREDETDEDLLAKIDDELTDASSPSDTLRRFLDRSVPGATRLRLIDDLSKRRARYEIGTRVEAMFSAADDLFADRKDDAIEETRRTLNPHRAER